jgi:hypothetical protein
MDRASLRYSLHAIRKLAEAAVLRTATPQAIHVELDRLRASARYADARCLVPFGHKVYSQTDEDGILREVFRRIGVTSRTFVEFGVGNGLENNTLALLFDGWTGLWIEGSAGHLRAIEAGFAATLASGRLKARQAMITRENIDALIAADMPAGEIDLLSVDIDGNDVHVFEAIRCIDPRVVVIEYNAKFAPPIEFCMAYDPLHRWQHDDCFGASLAFLEKSFARRNYALVGCNVAGANAFFVRADLAGDRFAGPFTAERHYEPARYHLAGVPSGHPASYRALERALAGGTIR